MKRVFSGIQPSGNLHIGNYIGALRQWVARQDERENIFCVVDLHAITVPQEPAILHKKIREIAAIYLAAGIDSKKSTIFVQSHNNDHAQLSWILNCFAGMGQLERMTQYKDKSRKQELVSVGLFDYPVLMAADILLYSADEVPVGDDQKQHVELARDLAERFNSRHGEEVFTLPEPVIGQIGARIMSLQNPLSKMSKSDSDSMATVGLLDDVDVAVSKIKKAVTDSGSEIVARDDKPAIRNLMQIYSELANESIDTIEQRYQGKGYGVFKGDLAEVVADFLKKFQQRYREIQEGENLEELFREGARKAQKISAIKLQQVMRVVGLG